MLAFLKLIRIQNLLIIAFTQYMVRWCLIYPLLKVRDIDLHFSNLNFFLLSLSTVMIAAAGYIINDYFDVNIDKINKPEKLLIDKAIKRRVAMGAHTVINILAIAIGVYVANAIGHWKLAILHFLCASSLWFYSTNFKRQFLVGNIIIAIFTAVAILGIGIYELLPCYQYYYTFGEAVSFKDVWIHVLALSFFAFITILLREIIKDMEDMEGDKEYGCKTIPIVLGIKTTKLIVTIIALATMLCLAYVQKYYWSVENFKAFIYFTLALQIPFVFLIYKVVSGENKKAFRVAGNTAKIIMLLGVCYLFIFANTILSFYYAI